MNLRTAVTTLPESADLVQDWADFEPAIRRQEALLGCEAPIPTKLGPRGGRRLTARFTEWLMGLPAGHVTDVPGLTRSEMLTVLGNGVVQKQAKAAFLHLLTEWPDVPDIHEKKESSA